MATVCDRNLNRDEGPTPASHVAPTFPFGDRRSVPGAPLVTERTEWPMARMLSADAQTAHGTARAWANFGRMTSRMPICYARPCPGEVGRW